jgi:outer membrane lipase/esterase
MAMRLVLAAGLLAAGMPAMAGAQDFDRIVAFGDSLTDDGNLYALTGIPQSPPYFAGRFSNGPVWVEPLTPLIGAQGLEVLAYGGAETGTDLTPPGIRLQVAGWLAQGNRAGPGTLSVVWGGANDYLGEEDTADPAGLVSGVVGNLERSVELLIQAGARTVLVPNLPDLGAVPAGRASGGSAQLSALSAAHNAGLAAAVEGLRLRHPGTEITLFDVGSLFRDALADPAAYGLTNVTIPCLSGIAPDPVSPTGACATPEQAATTLFFDPLHPTATGHDLLARFTAASLNAAGLAAAAAPARSFMALDGVASQSQALGTRLAALRSAGNGLVRAPEAVGLQYAAAEPVAGTDADLLERRLAAGAADRPFGIFALLDRDWGDRDPRARAAGFDYERTHLTLGADWQAVPGLRLGLAAGYGWGETDLTGSAGNAEMRSAMVGAYGSYGIGGWYLDADAGISFDDYRDIRRSTGFAPRPVAEADTDGRSWWVGGRTGYDLALGPVVLGPFAGLRYASTTIDGYTESGAGPLALTVEEQEASSLVGSLGARIGGLIELGGVAVAPSLRASWEHEFEDDPERLTAGLAGNRSSVKISPGDRDWVAFGAGLDLRLGEALFLTAEYEGTLGRSDGTDHSILGKVRIGF